MEWKYKGLCVVSYISTGSFSSMLRQNSKSVICNEVVAQNAVGLGTNNKI